MRTRSKNLKQKREKVAVWLEKEYIKFQTKQCTARVSRVVQEISTVLKEETTFYWDNIKDALE